MAQPLQICWTGPAEQMCRQDSGVHLSAEEEVAAEESLALYCKPVELYNIIQSRAARNPLYLQRCLRYKVEAKHKRRIQLTLSLHLSVDHGLQTQSIFPLYIMVARPASTCSIAEQSVRYNFKRCITLSTCAGDEGTSRGKAKIFLPESNKLSAEMKCGSLAILFISCVEPGVDHMNFASFQRQGGQCLLSKIPMELLDLSCGRSPNLGEGSETMLTVDLRPCVMMANCVDGEKCVSFQKAPTPAIMASMQRLEVFFTAEEIGPKYQSPCNSHSSGDIPSSSLSHITRSRIGNVAFNYKYYNNMLQKTEVTADFSCPFCLVKCASFKGLQCHLYSSHDRFKYDFSSTEEYQTVNVSVKSDTWRSESFVDGVESLKLSYSYCANLRRRRKPMNIVPSTNHVHPLVLESDLPMETNELRDEYVERGAPSQDTTRVSPAAAPSVDPTSTLPLPGRSQDTTRVSPATAPSVDPTRTLPLPGRSQDTTRVSPATAPSVDPTSTLPLPGRSQDTTRVSPATAPSLDPTSTLPLPGRSQNTARVSPATAPSVDPTSTLPLSGRSQDTTKVSPATAPSLDPTSTLPLPGRSQDTTRVSPATAPSVDPRSTLSLPGSGITTATTLQLAKTRKLSVERSDPKNNALLLKRQFFHSHRAQPMALEQVLSGQDSEDEIDDDVADFEDRMMLDDFVDVTKDEKQMMHMWNSFVRRQRVRADGHIPWACESFSKLHAEYLVQTPSVLWCWRIFMIKLWKHGILDPRTINNCNLIFEQLPPKQDTPSIKSLD